MRYDLEPQVLAGRFPTIFVKIAHKSSSWNRCSHLQMDGENQVLLVDHLPQAVTRDIWHPPQEVKNLMLKPCD